MRSFVRRQAIDFEAGKKWTEPSSPTARCARSLRRCFRSRHFCSNPSTERSFFETDDFQQLQGVAGGGDAGPQLVVERHRPLGALDRAAFRKNGRSGRRRPAARWRPGRGRASKWRRSCRDATGVAAPAPRRYAAPSSSCPAGFRREGTGACGPLRGWASRARSTISFSRINSAM